jgi:hypothetical protein
MYGQSKRAHETSTLIWDVTMLVYFCAAVNLLHPCLRMDEVWPNNKSSDYDVQDFYILIVDVATVVKGWTRAWFRIFSRKHKHICWIDG